MPRRHFAPDHQADVRALQDLSLAALEEGDPKAADQLGRLAERMARAGARLPPEPLIRATRLRRLEARLDRLERQGELARIALQHSAALLAALQRLPATPVEARPEAESAAANETLTLGRNQA